MSKNRKIFNLFKFVDEIYYIMKLSEDNKTEMHIRFFEIMAHCGSFVHFLFDNIVWMINTRIISKSLLIRQRLAGQQERESQGSQVLCVIVQNNLSFHLHDTGMEAV